MEFLSLHGAVTTMHRLCRGYHSQAEGVARKAALRQPPGVWPGRDTAEGKKRWRLHMETYCVEVVLPVGSVACHGLCPTCSWLRKPHLACLLHLTLHETSLLPRSYVHASPCSCSFNRRCTNRPGRSPTSQAGPPWTGACAWTPSAMATAQLW